MNSWDTPIDRRGTSATKWEKFDEAVLPFWVADMDLPTPDFILQAVRQRLEHPILGYTNVPNELNEALIDCLAQRYDWSVHPSWLVWIPGVVVGLNLAAQAVAQPNDPIYVMPPVYFPFLDIANNAQAQRVDVPLIEAGWRMDLDALNARANETESARQRLLLLCNPQNPTGRAYSEAELRALGDQCKRHNLVICSDEIHCDLLLDEKARHIPIASLDPDLADRSITLLAPTKTYNMPGLGCAVAVIPNPKLRHAFRSARRGLVSGITVLGYAAAIAAYRQDQRWIMELRDYLRGNYQRLASVAGSRLTPLQATYLGWLDVRDLAAQADPARFFESHGLGLSDGAAFGAPGFVRFNFACARPLLEQGLERLAKALAAIAV